MVDDVDVIDTNPFSLCSKSKPYCQCWNGKSGKPARWNHLSVCKCGEDNDVSEWKWLRPDLNSSSNNSVILSDNDRLVTFYPFYSSGTALVKGDLLLKQDYHYYWEVKVMTDTYGTDIMIGLGTHKVNILNSQFKFESFLGSDDQSYGISYHGTMRHDAKVVNLSQGFCKGTIVGVRVDMWQGTLEFYLNRKPQGIAFYNLRRHPTLQPMACSTAAQSCMRLTYSSSWPASLLVDAAKTLSASLSSDMRSKIPPGLWRTLKSQFWLTLPRGNCATDDSDEDSPEVAESQTTMLYNGKKRPHWQMIWRSEDTEER